MGAGPTYAFRDPMRSYKQPTVPAQTQQAQPQPQPPILQSMQPVQDNAPCWDDFNLSNINNIIGNVQPTADVIPDFDFVSDPLEL